MPNGVRLSPGGKTIYVSDTIFGRLWALDIDGPGKVKPGPLPVMPGRIVQTLPSFSIPQWFHEAFGVPPPPASPRPLQGIQWLDSLAVEANGQVCVGTIFNGGITIFDPDTGATTHETVPDIFTTNLCFGGPDMQDVWITASSTGKIYKARWPRPGLRLAHTLRDSRSGVLV
jgi:gluconolactonase